MKPELLMQQFWQLVKEKQYKKADFIAHELLRQYPNNIRSHYAVSYIALILGDGHLALTHIDSALNKECDNGAFIYHKARCLYSLGRVSEAVTAALTVAEKVTDNPELLCAAGTLLSHCEEHNLAYELLQSAVNLDPDNPQYLYNFAAVSRFIGNIDESETVYDKLIDINPQDYEAYYNRSELRRQTDDNNHINEMSSLIERGVKSRRDEILLHYALAKEYEDVNEHKKSFEHLTRGSQLRRSEMHYDVKNDIEVIHKIREIFDSSVFCEPPGGYNNTEPIFIIGMPRTGTTLVERILGSHSEVYAAGELNDFSNELIKLVQTGNNAEKISRIDLVEKTRNLNYFALGKNYVASVKSRICRTNHFIDKLPLNFLYTGLIHLALPDAKIIHVKRNPMDTCYAIYKRLFKGAYPFSYDLDELGKYFLAYYSLMDHWNEVLPDRIFQIGYENLVGDQENQTRRLIDYCGLEWQDDCLNFEENTAPSSTASASQVREPIYSSAIQKWKYYKKELAPLTQLFLDAGLTLDDSME